MARISTRDRNALKFLIRERSDFQTHGALRGHDVNKYSGKGILPSGWYESFERADYAVYSYDTPIAWHGNDGWTMPDTRYSVTTSRHQSAVRSALS